MKKRVKIYVSVFEIWKLLLQRYQTGPKSYNFSTIYFFKEFATTALYNYDCLFVTTTKTCYFYFIIYDLSQRTIIIKRS